MDVGLVCMHEYPTLIFAEWMGLVLKGAHIQKEYERVS
jgi:hypothetical protein